MKNDNLLTIKTRFTFGDNLWMPQGYGDELVFVLVIKEIRVNFDSNKTSESITYSLWSPPDKDNYERWYAVVDESDIDNEAATRVGPVYSSEALAKAASLKIRSKERDRALVSLKKEIDSLQKEYNEIEKSDSTEIQK